MTTSGTTTFISSRNTIINDALRLINILGENETASAYDLELSNRTLNRMIKSWENQAIHLWTKTTGVIFLQKNQSEYDLSSTSSDHATTTWYSTTLSANAAIGATSFTASSTVNMTISDYVGIEQADGTLHWTTIATIPDSITFTVNTGITVAASSGNIVWNYTTKLDQPVKVYSANYRSKSNIDVPMNEWSYQEYFEQPSKTSTGTPVNYNFDKQRDNAIIRVWPTPANVNFIMPITFSRKIQDSGTASNTQDFPQEWENAIIYNLAPLLAVAYGKNQGDRYVSLVQEAQFLLQEALDFDNELGSVYISPSYKGRRHT